MAHPITFKPAPVDPRKELMEQVARAPLEHADALLMAWSLLQEAHDQGILDLAKGLIGGKDIITGKLAEAANSPEAAAGIRNLIAMGRVLSSLDPDMLQRLARGMEHAAGEHKKEEKPPGWWALFKRGVSEDSRRGISFMTLMLGAVGRATKE
jgi:uncharacterized protein YjgD (DUF1641 family)